MRAMILAAGFGKRMRPLTDHTPKPSLKAGGKALIEHHILNLKAAGFNQIVINHAYLGEQIEAYLGHGEKYGVQIEYSAETEPLETGGGIYKALPQLGEGPFLVVNGDIWTEYDFNRIPKNLTGLIHLVLIPNPAHNPGGDFDLKDDQVSAEGDNKLTFSGIGVYDPAVFADSVAGRFPLAPLLREFMAIKQVTGECYSGQWMDIGTPERLQQLDELLNRA